MRLSAVNNGGHHTPMVELAKLGGATLIAVVGLYLMAELIAGRLDRIADRLDTVVDSMARCCGG